MLVNVVKIQTHGNDFLLGLRVVLLVAFNNFLINTFSTWRVVQ